MTSSSDSERKPESSQYGAYYGIYRMCRDAAWRCLIEFNMSSLPVNVREIARGAGIRVIRDSVIHELKPGELGVSISDGEHWTIIYDDRLPGEQCRAVVAHELGHIFLAHDYRFRMMRFRRAHDLENEADAFAARLLMPACLLHELGLHDYTEIAKLCRVPTELARSRARRLRTLELRGRFYVSPLENRMLENFRPWLSELGATCSDSPDGRAGPP